MEILMRKVILGLMGLSLWMGTSAPVEAVGSLKITNQAAVAVSSSLKVNDPAFSRQRYEMIMSQLDAGGDLLVVANLEGMIKETVESITKPILAMGKTSPDAEAVMKCISKVPGFLDKNGFYALQGFGMSVVPRADGLNTLKCFVARDPAAAGLPLWRALVGFNSKDMECTDFLPADTELARTGTAEWRSLWKMVRAGVVEIGTPGAAAAFDSQLAAMTVKNGMNLDTIFDSFSGECFFSIQFSKTASVDLPGSGTTAPVKMPQPSFLLGIAVSNDTLVTSLEAALAKSGILPLANAGEMADIKSINIPLPMPIPFKPSYAVHSNFFLFGSTPTVVAQGIKAFTAKNGLTATPEFKKAFAGLPMRNNGIAYMSPRFMNTITQIQKAYLCQPRDGDEGLSEVMEQLLGARDNMQSSMVILNQKNGVLTIGNSSAGGKELMTSLMVAPVGLLSAIAIPSFMKARTQSQQNACINNLRQIEAAKEQWALANRKNQNDDVIVPEVLQYLKGAKMPICPQGGKYTLNAIGVNCKCSIPGHEMMD